MFFFIPLKYITGFLLALLVLYLLVRLITFLIRLIWPYVKIFCAFIWCQIQALFAFIYESRWLALLLSPLLVLASIAFTRYCFPLRSFCASWQELMAMASVPLFIAVGTFTFAPRERDTIAMWPLLCSTVGCYIGLLLWCWHGLDLHALTFIGVLLFAGLLVFLSRGDNISRLFLLWGLVDALVALIGFFFIASSW